MKATGILIDPTTRTISEINLEGDFTKIQEAINCRCFTTAPMIGADDCYMNEAVFVDDEGLFVKGNPVWKADFLIQPLVGKGLILGCDEEGESITPTITLEQVKEAVQWTNRVTIGG